jgi:hypothetical protein
METSAPVVQPVAAEPAGSTGCEPERIEINTASADDLNRLGSRIGKAIMAGRPILEELPPEARLYGFPRRCRIWVFRVKLADVSPSQFGWGL